MFISAIVALRRATEGHRGISIKEATSSFLFRSKAYSIGGNHACSCKSDKNRWLKRS